MMLSSIFNFNSYANNRETDLKVNLEGNLSCKPDLNSAPISDFIKVTLSNQTLTLEFFQDASDVIIMVTDETNNIIFNETMEVCPTLHRFIFMGQYLPGYYTINIYNTSGIDITGSFGFK